MSYVLRTFEYRITDRGILLVSISHGLTNREMRVRPAEESGFSCRAAWSGRPVRFMSPRHGIHFNADALLLQAFLRVIYSARHVSPFQDNFKGTTRLTPKCTLGNSSSRPVTAPDPMSHPCRSHQHPAAGPRQAARDDACFRRLHALTAQLKIRQPQSPKPLTSSLIPFLPPKGGKRTILKSRDEGPSVGSPRPDPVQIATSCSGMAALYRCVALVCAAVSRWCDAGCSHPPGKDAGTDPIGPPHLASFSVTRAGGAPNFFHVSWMKSANQSRALKREPKSVFGILALPEFLAGCLRAQQFA